MPHKVGLVVVHMHGASGNIVTEDLVYLLESMGLRTGIDIDRLVEAREWLKQGIPESHFTDLFQMQA